MIKLEIFKSYEGRRGSRYDQGYIWAFDAQNKGSKVNRRFCRPGRCVEIDIWPL